MKKFILFTLFVLSFTNYGLSQSDYKSAIGLRFGGGYYDLISGSYKTFISQDDAVELNVGFKSYGYFGFNWTSLSFAGSYQRHFDIGNVDGLKWFVGGGLQPTIFISNIEDYSGFQVSLFPTGGVDYKFETIPLNLTLDLRILIDILDGIGYDEYNRLSTSFGIGARYTLK